MVAEKIMDLIIVTDSLNSTQPLLQVSKNQVIVYLNILDQMTKLQVMWN